MVYESLDDLIGAKYEPNGRGPRYDCGGLVLEVAKRFNITLPRISYNSIHDINKDVIRDNIHLLTQIHDNSSFCVVMLAPRLKFTSHVGFVLDYPYFIHVQKNSNVTINRLDYLIWLPRVRGFYR